MALSFEKWEQLLDARLRGRLFGMGLDAIEDQPTWNMFESGMSTREAADQIVDAVLLF